MSRRTIWLLSVIVIAFVITASIMQVAIKNLTFHAEEDPPSARDVTYEGVVEPLNFNKNGDVLVREFKVNYEDANYWPCPPNYQPAGKMAGKLAFPLISTATEIIGLDNPVWKTLDPLTKKTWDSPYPAFGYKITYQEPYLRGEQYYTKILSKIERTRTQEYKYSTKWWDIWGGYRFAESQIRGQLRDGFVIRVKYNPDLLLCTKVSGGGNPGGN